jgi:hypothetical protein
MAVVVDAGLAVLDLLAEELGDSVVANAVVVVPLVVVVVLLAVLLLRVRHLDGAGQQDPRRLLYSLLAENVSGTPPSFSHT